MAIQITNQYANKYDRLRVAAASTPLFSESDWRTAMANGTAEIYTNALMKAKSINPADFYKKYGLYYGNPESTLNALLTETSADRNTLRTYEVPVMDENGNIVTDENGKTLMEKVDMTQYDYEKNMIYNANQLYQRSMAAAWAEQDRQNRQNLLGDIGAVGGQLGVSLLKGVENIGSLLGAVGEEALVTSGRIVWDAFTGASSDDKYSSYWDYLQGNSSFAETMNKWYTDWAVGDDLQASFDQFVYNYSHFYDQEGNMNTPGRWLTGISDMVGKMLPTIAVSYATAGVGGALTAKSTAAGNLGSLAGAKLTASSGAIGQLAFYGANVFGQTVSDQYEYYASQGMSVSSAEIVANAAVKTALQYGVEKALGAILGETGIDKLIWGKQGNSKLRFSNKNITKRAFGRLGKDMLQEGIEETLQEASDYFVDAAHHFINNDFQKTEWNWQNIIDSFVIAAITSIGGNAAKIVGTKRINLGTVKTTEAGELVKNDAGEFEYNKKLSKLASWEFAYDLEAFTDAINSVEKASNSLGALFSHGPVENSSALQKALSEHAAAYYEAVASFELLAGLYGEMGAERFNKANSILKEIRKYADDGIFNKKLVDKARNQFVERVYNEIEDLNFEVKGVDKLKLDYKKMLNEELAKAKIQDLVKVIDNEDDDDETDDSLSKAAHSIMDKDKSVSKVFVAAYGTRPVRFGNALIIPENFLRQDPNGKLTFQADAEYNLAKTLTNEILNIKGVSLTPLELISDLYKQWSGDSDATDEEAVMNLMFDPAFFNCVLAMNEKETVTFLLRLRSKIDSFKFKDNTKDKVFAKSILDMQKRWTQGAIDFYSNNLDANFNEYARFIKGEERTKFLETVERQRYLFKASNKFVAEYNKVTDSEWEFLWKRIDNAKTTNDVKNDLKTKFKSNNAVDRAEAMNKLNLIYEGAFQTLYNGDFYMPCTSVANMTFNNFLKASNLNIQTFVDTDYLSDQEKSELGDGNIIDYRQEQFMRFVRGKYNFVISKNGKITIKGDNKAVGWSAADNYLSKQDIRGNVLSGKNVEFDTSEQTKKSRMFSNELQSTSKLFRSMLDPTVHEQGIASWVSIDDVINNPLYLTEDIQNKIVEEYGSLATSNVYVYLQKEFANRSEGKQSIVTLRDGTTAIQNMSKIEDLFQSKVKFPSKGKYKLDDFISEKARTAYSKNATVVFGAKRNAYIDWEKQVVNGKYVWVFVNRIEISASTEQDEIRFKLAHEMQHLYQYELSMNAGISTDVLSLFDKTTQNKIINSIKKSAPELFINKPDTVQTRGIVNRYLYYGTGEMQSMGLSSTKEMAAYPIRSRRSSDGLVTITLPDGTSYSSKGKISALKAVGLIKNAVFKMVKANYDNFVYETDKEHREERFKAGEELFNKMIFEKEADTLDNKIETLYQYFGYKMSKEEFMKSKLLTVNINDNWYLISNLNALEKVLASIGAFTSNPIIKYGTIETNKITDLSFFDRNRNNVTAKVTFDAKDLSNMKRNKVNLSDEFDTVEQSLSPTTPNGEPFLRKIVDRITADLGGSEITETVYFEPLRLCLNQFNDRLKNLMRRYLSRRSGDRVDVGIKAAIKDAITPEVREASLKRLYKHRIDRTLTFSEFLESRVPIIRYEKDYEVSNFDSGVKVMNTITMDTFVSAIIYSDEYDVQALYHYMAPSRYGHYGENNDYDEYARGAIYETYVKVKDIMLYIEDHNGEILVDPDVFSDAVQINIDGISGDVYEGPYYKEFVIGENLETQLSFSDLANHTYKVIDGYDEPLKSRLMHLANKIFPAVDRIYDNRVEEGLKPMFRLINDYAHDYFDAAAWHWSVTDCVIYRDIYYQDAEILLHELIHFCLVKAMRRANSRVGVNAKYFGNDKETKVGQLLIKLYHEVLKTTGMTKADFYGLTDVDEFLAELTNPEFYKFLQEQKLSDELNKAFEEMFDMKFYNVAQALRVGSFYMLENVQHLDDENADTSLMKDYHMYMGPLYDDGKLIKESAENTTVFPMTHKLIDKFSQAFAVPKNEDESYADYLRRLLSDETKKDKIISVITKNLKDKGNYDNIDTLYIDGEFPLYVGKISDYTVSPKTEVKETTVEETPVETTEATEVVESAETTETTETTEDKNEPSKEEPVIKKRSKSRYSAIVDKREIQSVEFNPEIHRRSITSLPSGVTEKDIIRKVYDVDYNEDEDDRKPGARNANYFYRKFLYRAYYIDKFGKKAWRDIYEKWEMKPEDTRYISSKRWKDTNLKYFKKDDREQLQLHVGLANLIEYSTHHELPKELQDKISGDEKGTLTLKDVQFYLANATNLDNDTFKVINDCIYKNKFIKTIEDRNKVRELLPKLHALRKVLSKTNYKDEIFDTYSIEELERVWLEYMYNPDLKKVLEDAEDAFDKKASDNSWVKKTPENEKSKDKKSKDKKSKDKKSEDETVIDTVEILDFSEPYIMHKIMALFDGNIISASDVAVEARIDAWNYMDHGKGNLFRSGQKATVSLDEAVGEDKEGGDSDATRGEFVADEADLEYVEKFQTESYYNKSRGKMTKELTNLEQPVGEKIARILFKECKRQNISYTEFVEKVWPIFRESIDKYEIITDSQVLKIYTAAKLDRLTDEILDDLYFLADISPDVENEKRRESSEAYTKKEEEIAARLKKVTREERNLESGIKRQANGTIRGKISETNRARFLKENGDLFEKDGSTVRLKDSVLYELKDGELVLRDRETLIEIKARMNEISKAVRGLVYETDASLKYYKALQKAQKENERLREKIIDGKTDSKVYRLALGNGNSLDVDDESHIPPALKRLIELGKAKDAATEVQFFSNSEEREVEKKDKETGEIRKVIETVYTEKHAKIVYDNFLNNSAEILAEIGQEGADEIVDFYLANNKWIIAGNEDRIAMNLQQLLIGYFYSKHLHNSLNFTEERLNKMSAYLEAQASIAGSWLSNQKTILSMLKKTDSDETVNQALIDYIGIPMTDEDRANLKEVLKAVRNTQDKPEVAKAKYMAAKQKFQEGLAANYKLDKRSFLQKVLTWERAMMLSSPGTWLRNWTSNWIVTGGNIASGYLGDQTFKLLNNLFPKSKWFNERQGQYKIVGTKVSENTAKFVKTAFIDSGFFNEVGTGLSKYDPRKIGRNSSGDNIVDMMALKIGNEIKQNILFGGNSKFADGTNWVVSKIFSMISDDKSIRRKVVSYLGKIIEEEKAKNPKLKLELASNSMYGISNEMLDLFTKAYELAASDYMHGSNWIMDMERQLRLRIGDKGYFIYKQIFPFLGAAWQWSLEGMRYSPFGLIKAIFNFAKLENTITKMDEAKRKGKTTINSEFAEYVAKRNLGKGVIGSIGWSIGIILTFLGIAGIDDEDDEYKLIIADHKISINDVLGSQSIILGIATTTELFKGGMRPDKALIQILNQMFDDSAFQSVIDAFRYKSGVGGFAKELVFDDIPSMLWPNFLKYLAKMLNHQTPIHGDGLGGWLAEAASRNIPGAQFLLGENYQIDPYTGKAQSFWSLGLLQKFVNLNSPMDVEFTDMSDYEFKAVALGVKTGSLTGNYKIDDEKVNLTAKDKTKLNVLYGNLNKQSLSRLYSGSEYKSMNEKEKKAAIESVLSTNSRYSKIYILTNTGKYKYYASESEYENLRKLGITKNVYRKTKDKNGFVKVN